MNYLLTKISSPTLQQTKQLTEFLHHVFHAQSAAHNGNLITRKDIAAELGALVHKNFPGLCYLHMYKMLFFGIEVTSVWYICVLKLFLLVYITHYIHMYVDVSIGVHGSSASEFALLSSDVNIFLNIPEPETNTHQV